MNLILPMIKTIRKPMVFGLLKQKSQKGKFTVRVQSLVKADLIYKRSVGYIHVVLGSEQVRK